MKEHFDFEKYSEDRKKYYDILAEYKIDESQISQPLILDSNFFKKVNIEFEMFFERRKQKERLSKVESKDYKERFNQLNQDILNIYNHKGPAIYWFKIAHLDDSINAKIVKRFSHVKIRNSGWWSKANKFSDNNTEYLYVGKVEKNLHDRFIQHIGLGHKMTSSLKLAHWFYSFEKTQLAFQFLKVDIKLKDYLEDIENVIWRQLNPLIGNEPRIK